MRASPLLPPLLLNIAWFSHGEFRLRQPSKWSIAISGGEQVTSVLLRGFRALEVPGLRIFNAYGPTEVTCSSKKMELPYAAIDSSHERMPAGKASPNCFVYIVDKGLKPVPIGVRGEILSGVRELLLAILMRSLPKRISFLTYAT